MRIRKILISCVVFGLCTALAGLWIVGVLSHKQYAARGTFYYWLYGLENVAGFSTWGGPDPLWCFKEDIWNKRPDDFVQRVIGRLCDSYGMDKDRIPEAASVIESIVFCHTSISFTWQELIAVSHDPMFAANVANATMDVLYELDLERQESRRAATIRYLSDAYEHARNDKESRVKRMANAKSEREKSDEEARVAQLSQRMDNCERQIALYREMDVRTNTMFKIMIPAGVATNIVTRRIAQRLREQREGLSPWR